jgi:hypothetical protein
VNPYVAKESHTIGIGLGAVLASDAFIKPKLDTGSIPVSGHLRLGLRSGPNIAVRYMEGVPLVAGGGYGDVGVGLPLGRFGDAWVGMGFDGPSDLQPLGVRARLQIIPHLWVVVGGYRASNGDQGVTGVRVSGWHVGLEWQLSGGDR